MRVFIYALCEPDTGEIRYVGQSVDPRARFASHLSDSAASQVRTWVAFLRERDLEPLLALLDDTDDPAQADALELRYIAQLRRPRLLNSDVAPVVHRMTKAREPNGLAERVRALRLNRRMTQEQLAERSGGLLTRLDVNKIEAGLNQGRSHRVRAGLATSFGVEFGLMNAYLDGSVPADLLLEEAS